MKKILLCLLFLTACSDSESVKNKRFAVATPAMFTTCTEKCTKLGFKLDKIYLNVNYGTNSHSRPWCNIHINCACQEDKGTYINETIVTPDNSFYNIVEGSSGISTYSTCEKMWKEDK